MNFDQKMINVDEIKKNIYRVLHKAPGQTTRVGCKENKNNIQKYSKHTSKYVLFYNCYKVSWSLQRKTANGK